MNPIHTTTEGLPVQAQELLHFRLREVRCEQAPVGALPPEELARCTRGPVQMGSSPRLVPGLTRLVVSAAGLL